MELGLQAVAVLRLPSGDEEQSSGRGSSRGSSWWRRLATVALGCGRTATTSGAPLGSARRRHGTEAALRWRARRRWREGEATAHARAQGHGWRRLYRGAGESPGVARTPRSRRRRTPCPPWTLASGGARWASRLERAEAGPLMGREAAAHGRGEKLKGRQRTSISGLRLLGWASSGESPGSGAGLRKMGSAR